MRSRSQKRGAILVVLFGLITVSTRLATAQSENSKAAHFAYCGKTFKSLVLFHSADFQSDEVARLDCGQPIIVLSTRGTWARVRTKDGLVGYEPTWFVGPPTTGAPSKSGKCNRPSPLGSVDQFERLSAIFDKFIDVEKFTPSDFQSVSREDTEKLAADAYFGAYLTAENPNVMKEAISRNVVDEQIFGKDFPKLSPIQQIDVEIYVQKLLNVLTKAMDLGFQEGSKYPCGSK